MHNLLNDGIYIPSKRVSNLFKMSKDADQDKGWNKNNKRFLVGHI